MAQLMKKNKINLYKKIDAYIKGNLSEPEIAELWIAFAKHPYLLDELEIEIGLRDILKKEILVRNRSPKKKFSLSESLIWHYAAAAMLFVIFSMQFFQQPSKSRLANFTLSSINKDQLETADIVRSTIIDTFAADSILNLGFMEYINDNYTGAFLLYNELLTNYNHEPYASKAYLNKGIFHYNNSNYDLAIVDFSASLERSPDDTMIKEKAFWFLANAYAHIDDLQNARNNAYEVYKMNGIFRKASFLLLQKLNYDLGSSDTETSTD